MRWRSAFQRFGQAQRALAQPFFPRAGLGLHDGRLAGAFGGADGVEVGRQEIGEVAGVPRVGPPIGAGLVARDGERADDLAMHDHRHMDAGAERVVVDRAG